ncbi:TetR/AcrR family transcriptional regulator [Actinomadura nitritigenes]|uniref:TetR/AcrR family transcriptional regulator n=1 Tax=Actinomadura nitritigenes TaxID=134602 RepID=A0ABS3RFI7_9ACTN|nr:TetR/AcrR family transcriptional regulator [Actinomadura nitritigenes]MBO2444875.1 TetR/AcrR family transcriptional regulator [Actinomadura nitritigenes]
MTTQTPKRRGRPSTGAREAILRATLELLREQGVARFTTPEVAQRAGVSEASIFYHFNDRVGLLRAAFQAGLDPLREQSTTGFDDPDPEVMLDRLTGAIEGFLDQSLPVLMAAQSDVELREALADYLDEHDLGPHRGVNLVTSCLLREQRAGRLAADGDAQAVAMMLVGSSFLRTAQNQIMGTERPLPSRQRINAAITAMLRPSGD